MARGRRRLVGTCAAIAAISVIALLPGVSAAQTPGNACAGRLALVNGGFEDPSSIDAFAIIDEAKVPGWTTSEPDGRIELWQTGYYGVPAAAGEQFAELAANEPGELYQDLTTVPGALLGYTVSHRGRHGVDTMQIQIGAPAAAPNYTRDVSTGNTAWQQVLGTYRVPTGQTRTRFGFAALSSASPSISAGNFLDGVAFAFGRCSITLSKRLVPATDPGRFDLLVGDQVIVPAAGDGGRTEAPVPVVLGAMRVAERAATGSSLDRYASAVVCRDRASGDLLAQAAGPDLLLSFDRPRNAACTLTNVRAPAVVATKVLHPPNAAGRFDLLIDGRVQSAAAGDRGLAGPVALGAGERVVVSERPAAGTQASDYTSSIQCRSRAGLGPIVAEATGTRVSYQAADDQIVACVLVNLRRNPPPPAPVPVPDPAPVPAGGGAGELDLRLTAQAVTPRVPADANARWLVTVDNPSPVAGTDVRLKVAVRQAGLIPSAGALTMTGGACAPTPNVGLCQIARIEPGESVTARAQVRSRDLAAPLRLIADVHAVEPEPVLSNNLDFAPVQAIPARTPARARPCRPAAAARSVIPAAC